MRLHSVQPHLRPHRKILWLWGKTWPLLLTHFEKCVLKLSSVAQTALGTVVKSAGHCGRDKRENKEKVKRTETGKQDFGPEAVCKLSLHRCDSWAAFINRVCVSRPGVCSHWSFITQPCLEMSFVYCWQRAIYMYSKMFQPNIQSCPWCQVITQILFVSVYKITKAQFHQT